MKPDTRQMKPDTGYQKRPDIRTTLQKRSVFFRGRGEVKGEEGHGHFCLGNKNILFYLHMDGEVGLESEGGTIEEKEG